MCNIQSKFDSKRDNKKMSIGTIISRYNYNKSLSHDSKNAIKNYSIHLNSNYELYELLHQQPYAEGICTI